MGFFGETKSGTIPHALRLANDADNGSAPLRFARLRPEWPFVQKIKADGLRHRPFNKAFEPM